MWLNITKNRQARVIHTLKNKRRIGHAGVQLIKVAYLIAKLSTAKCVAPSLYTFMGRESRDSTLLSRS
uniref:Uncharacterized protein n=1 Tax=Anguilla anguilla TaxID=7936 RepID=A0A0E9WND6_ANGAN